MNSGKQKVLVTGFCFQIPMVCRYDGQLQGSDHFSFHLQRQATMTTENASEIGTLFAARGSMHRSGS
jgi:hypothetical protein